ncbi:helicase C-terminal domain-containing protein, partial [Pavlovales sp. CCMP2436]
ETRDLKRRGMEDAFAHATEQRKKRVKRLEGTRLERGRAAGFGGSQPLHARAGAGASTEQPTEEDLLDFQLGDEENSMATSRAFVPSDEDERAPLLKSAHVQEDELAPVRPPMQVRRTRFGSSVSCVSLGSRKQLCVHAPVAKLGSAARINDGCQSLQRSSGAGCPLLHPRTAPAQQALRDTLLASPVVLEELAGLGKSLGCCPYYGARSASVGAHVLLVPYSCLLHEQTRDALGIRLESSVVLLDEAHNLLEALNDVHSVEIYASQLAAAYGQLGRYLERYRTLLSGPNRSSLCRLLRFVKALRDTHSPPSPSAIPPTTQPASPLPGCATNPTATPPVTPRTAPHKAPPASPYTLGSPSPKPAQKPHTTPHTARALRDASAPASPLLSAKPSAKPASVHASPVPAAKSAVSATAVEAGKMADDGTSVHSVNAFLAQLRIDNLNLWELLEFCNRTQLARKVQARDAGLAACEQRGGGAALASATYAVIRMLRALTSADGDGRVLVRRGGASADVKGASVKLLHLNPMVHLAPIVRSCRALLLCGGTMEPLEELLDALTDNGKHSARLRVRRFGHVVPAVNLAVLTVRAADEGDALLKLVAAQRGTDQTLDALGRAIGHCRRATPGGLIVFVPSFAYMHAAHTRWAQTGALAKELGACGARVFSEPREATELERVLAAYAAAVRAEPALDLLGDGGGAPRTAAEPSGGAACGGRATLLAVVGGKMSEGINFADELGRCVVMVGLPYPNLRDPELVERMAFLNARQAANAKARATLNSDGGGGGGGGLATAAQRYYEGLCMRAVNQSIGRVIRHAADYAAIVLLDARYEQPRVQSKLPAWIRQSLGARKSAAAAAVAMREFFHERSRGGDCLAR